MELSAMSPRRPYILRAFNEWLLDNDLTPHLVVDATLPYVDVPQEFVRDGQIVLNIAPHASGHLELGNDAITFSARFGGVLRQIYIPLAAVIALYARENGAGTLFEPEPAYELEQSSEIVSDTAKETSSMSLMHTEQETPPEDDPPKPTRARPALRVVK